MCKRRVSNRRPASCSAGGFGQPAACTALTTRLQAAGGAHAPLCVHPSTHPLPLLASTLPCSRCHPLPLPYQAIMLTAMMSCGRSPCADRNSTTGIISSSTLSGRAYSTRMQVGLRWVFTKGARALHGARGCKPFAPQARSACGSAAGMPHWVPAPVLPLLWEPPACTHQPVA